MRHFRLWRAIGVLALGVVPPCSPVVCAQSLADVARAEEARRKATPRAAKVYTNADLQPDARSGQPVLLPSTPAGLSPVPAPDAAAKEAGPEPEPRTGERYWRSRITDARERLDRAQLFAEALQSRINALTTDFVNRDDPAQRAVIGQERQRAVDELGRVQKEIEEFAKAIASIEEEARRAGVPPGWLR